MCKDCTLYQIFAFYLKTLYQVNKHRIIHGGHLIDSYTLLNKTTSATQNFMFLEHHKLMHNNLSDSHTKILQCLGQFYTILLKLMDKDKLSYIRAKFHQLLHTIQIKICKKIYNFVDINTENAHDETIATVGSHPHTYLFHKHYCLT